MKYKTKQYPEYSIQFWFDKRLKQDNVRFLETSNMKVGYELKNINDIDMNYFALTIVKSDLLDEKDKQKLAYFCKKYLEHLN